MATSRLNQSLMASLAHSHHQMCFPRCSDATEHPHSPLQSVSCSTPSSLSSQSWSSLISACPQLLISKSWPNCCSSTPIVRLSSPESSSQAPISIPLVRNPCQWTPPKWPVSPLDLHFHSAAGRFQHSSCQSILTVSGWSLSTRGCPTTPLSSYLLCEWCAQ